MVRAFFPIDATNHNSGVVNFRCQGFTGNGSDVFGRIFNAFEKFRLRLQTAVDVNVNELVREKLVERLYVLLKLGLIPK